MPYKPYIRNVRTSPLYETPSQGVPLNAYSPPVSSRTQRPLPFDSKKIGEEIEAARVRLGIPVETIADRIGLKHRTAWYPKTRGAPPFRWEEAAKISREFHAPKGWPIVPWDEGLAWERWLERDKE
jgi:hypothetical protein